MGKIMYMINNQLGILTISIISHIKIINIEKIFFCTKSNTMEASLGTPIFSYDNKLIGIYYNKNKSAFTYNLYCTFLNYPINKFIFEHCNSNIINEINNI